MLLFTCCLAVIAPGQAIDNTLSYKNINADKYFRLNYENDYFAGSDLYYTQGMHIELVSPWIKKIPVSKLLFHPRYYNIRYGLALEHDAYTPTVIATADKRVGDRPYAGALFLKSFLTATDSILKRRFSATLSYGVIGPAAGTSDMQEEIHRILPRNTIPQGWHNQIRNDIILNYQCEYEKQILQWGNILSVDADVSARLGTLSDKTSTGVTIIFGYIDSLFSRVTSMRSLRFYAYEHAEGSLVGYDATMQGGLFSNSSYTIPAADVTRLTFHNRFGIVLNYRKINLEYFQSYLTPEFRTGNFHVWGGFQIAIGL